MFILRNTNGSDIYCIYFSKLKLHIFYLKDKGIQQTEVQILETQMAQIIPYDAPKCTKQLSYTGIYIK